MKQILVAFDTDPQPSVFDGVVAVDAGVDFLFRHAGVSVDAVRDLVYGAIFTRAPNDLKNTALFIGGSNVEAGEAVLAEVQRTFFGPLRVSVMLDSNGSNTTAVAAVLAAGRHATLRGAQATVLAATGPVGQRVVRLLADEGAAVRVTSRRLPGAEAVCEQIRKLVPNAELTPFTTDDPAALADAAVAVACGPPGVELVSADHLAATDTLRVAVDLNAVPPLGIGGIEMGDRAVERGDCVCYGAIGVGGGKMKIHKRAIARLFEANDLVLDAVEIYELGKALASG
ncbi:methylenetetrahydromethanopterin dehydrogenase [Pirellulales bacterium]|nr:methylenetetrahydromethanopterin dehydrogenase [Pirellulales bacterium]